jgi:hypothetical protein
MGCNDLECIFERLRYAWLMADILKQMQDNADAFKKKLDEQIEAAERHDQEVLVSATSRIRPVPVRHWLYRCELLSGMTSVSPSARLDALNKGLESLGRDSWELCAVVPWDSDTLLVFKCPHFE